MEDFSGLFSSLWSMFKSNLAICQQLWRILCLMKHLLCLETSSPQAKFEQGTLWPWSEIGVVFDLTMQTFLFVDTWSVRNQYEMSTTKPAKWSVRPAKTEISLGFRPVSSESSLSAWRNISSLTTHTVHSEDWSDNADSFCLFVVLRLLFLPNISNKIKLSISVSWPRIIL